MEVVGRVGMVVKLVHEGDLLSNKLNVGRRDWFGVQNWVIGVPGRGFG